MKVGKRHTPTPRGQGRPKKDEADLARAALVGAARELLRTRPPADINRLDIARAAGVDPGLIRYYFGNKDRLLLETGQQLMHEMRAQREVAHHDQASFRGKLAAYTRYLVDVLHRYPFLHDLLLEQIAQAGATHAEELRRDFIDQPWQELRALLEQAAASKEIRPVDPSFFYVALIGMCSFPMRHQLLLGLVRETQDVDARTAMAYAEFVADVLAEGIARGEPRAARSALRAAKVA